MVRNTIIANSADDVSKQYVVARSLPRSLPKLMALIAKTVWSVACMPENLLACPKVANLMPVACGGAMD